MTTELYLAAIAVGSTMLTLVGLYIGWRSFRVFLLRLELLSIRNALWDDARALNCLDDPAYRTYRENLNLMVRYAHKIDLISLALSSRNSDAKSGSCPNANPKLKVALDRALTSTARCMTNYLLWHRPFTGIGLVWTLNIAVGMMRFVSYFRRFSSSVFKSSVAQIRSFGQTPHLKTKQWFENNGPAIVFGR